MRLRAAWQVELYFRRYVRAQNLQGHDGESGSHARQPFFR
jgi:hypothetical protein